MAGRVWCGLMLAVAALAATPLFAQPSDLPIAPATTDSFPPGVKIARLPRGAVYTDAAGRTLYGMDMRVLLRAGPDPALYCTGACADEWTPLRAPKSAAVNIRYPGGAGRSRADGAPDPDAGKYLDNRTAPDWTVIAGPAGPQYVYKGWHMVFVRRGDAPGRVDHDGADGRVWNTLKYVPPVPAIAAPGGVRPVFTGGSYALADGAGRLLFTGTCTDPCTTWQPLAGGMASAAIGPWRVVTSGDTPQWSYHGAPVFVSRDTDAVPAGGKLLRP